jgi:DNA-binding CsgD family transcriptional regulator
MTYDADQDERVGAALKRIELLVAMVLVQEMSESTQRERIVALSRAGLTNPEIARLLGTTSPVVSQQLYSAKARRGRSTEKSAKRR